MATEETGGESQTSVATFCCTYNGERTEPIINARTDALVGFTVKSNPEGQQ